jgi:hypothetical protein
VLTPLESALLHHGKESFTHHRAWTLTHHPDKGWAEVLQAWLDGDSFGWAADRSDRNALARPTVLDAALPALAAADAAWHALLDGLVLAGRQPYLLAQPTPGRFSPYGDWMLAASLLAHPAHLTPDTAHRTPARLADPVRAQYRRRRSRRARGRGATPHRTRPARRPRRRRRRTRRAPPASIGD